MKKKKEDLPVSDIEQCKNKINRILEEYNCRLISADEWSGVLIVDCDTEETVNWRS